MELRVNGRGVTIPDEGDRSLLAVLREELGLTGSKYGCGEGQCGACTVLIDGSPARSCITPAKAAAGRHITTIEGLETEGRLHPVQQAFLDADAMQCGYCTAGMIIASVALLKNHPNPTGEDIRRGLEGSICRCGTYPRIAEAVKRAAGSMKRGAGKGATHA